MTKEEMRAICPHGEKCPMCYTGAERLERHNARVKAEASARRVAKDVDWLLDCLNRGGLLIHPKTRKTFALREGEDVREAVTAFRRSWDQAAEVDPRLIRG